MAYALDNAGTLETLPVSMERSTEIPEAASALSISEAAGDIDEELLRKLAANDEAAFRLLVERHIDRAFGIALRLLGSRADAEDVVQDTMLKVWTHRGQWEPGRAKFSTWLYRVITNRCIDLHRVPRTDNVDAVPQPADAQPDVVSAMQRNEVTDMLERAMQRLPEQQRAAVSLSSHANRSNGDVREVR